MLSGTRVSSSVSLNSCSISRTGSTVRLFGSSTRRTSSADSSRTSASSGSFFACSSSAMRVDQPRLRHLVGNFGDDDLIGAAAGIFAAPSARAGGSCRARSCRPRTIDLARLDDDAAGRKIGPGHEIDQLVGGGVGELDQMQRRVAQLADIVRRDVGRHADGDAGRRRWRAGWGNWPGSTDGSCSRAVVVGAEVDGVLVDAVEQLRARSRSAALRCSGRRRGYRRRYCRNCPGRRSADSGRRSPARGGPARRRSPDCRAGWKLPIMSPTILAHFAKLALRLEPELAHGVEHAPVHGLQPVAHVGQRPVHDGGERVGEVALFQRLAQIHGLDRPLRIRRRRSFSHDVRLAHLVAEQRSSSC